MISSLYIKNNLACLEEKIGYRFLNQELLIEALCHPSLKQNTDSVKYRDYERLELLGDSILGFIITEMLFNKFIGYHEGEISKIKSYLISQQQLYRISQEISIADYIIMADGEAKSGGRDNPSNAANVMEAILAAIYLDSNIKTVKEIIYKFWSSDIKNIDINYYDPKTFLQEWAQSNNYDIPKYSMVSSYGPPHALSFFVEVNVGPFIQKGTGKSRKGAEKDAAKKLILLINSK